MRRFIGYRPNPPKEYVDRGLANPASEPQYEGILFTDGTVAIRWCTGSRSHSIWSSFEDFMAIHGHPEYGTIIKWLDEPWINEEQCVCDEKPCEREHNI